MSWLISLLLLIFATPKVDSATLTKESRKVIIVLDTGISSIQKKSKALCKNINDINNLDKFVPSKSHGINIFNLIETKINTKKYCIYPIMYDHTAGMGEYLNKLKAAEYIKNAVALNLSVSSEGYNLQEEIIIKRLIEKNIVINAAAGNNSLVINSKSECKYYPACLRVKFTKNFNVVTSNSGVYSNTYNIFPTYEQNGTNVGEPKLTGTSQSTAIFTGNLYKR